MSLMSIHSGEILCWVPGRGLLLPRVRKRAHNLPSYCVFVLHPHAGTAAMHHPHSIRAAGAEARQDRGSSVVQLHAINSYRGWISGAHL